MKRLPIFLRTISDRRRSLIWWSIGLSALTVLSVILYPSVRGSDFQQLMENIPSVMREMFSLDVINTPAGYMNARHFSLTAPLLIMIFAIGMGADLTAGEEERGTMDLLLSHPVSRVRVVMEKTLALFVCVGVVQLAGFLAVVLFAPLVDMTLPVSDLAAAIVSQSVMGMTFGLIALAIGCRSGSRGSARAGSASLAIVSYVLSVFAPLVDWLEPYRGLSLFYQGQGYEPVLNGWQITHFAVLGVVGSIALAGALMFFRRRDISI